MWIQTAAMAGTSAELAEAAEDIDQILNAKARDWLDLTPTLERWLVDVLEEIDAALD